MRMTSKMAVSRLLTTAALVQLCVQGSHAEVLTPGQKDLIKAERKLEAARERVSVTAEYLSATQSLRMARLGLVRACQSAHDALDRTRKEAQKSEALARSDAAEADQFARQATLAVAPSRNEMERARARFLSRPLLAYDLSQRGRLTFNTLTGALDVTLDEGPGITLKAGDLDALLAGRFVLPASDPLQMAATTSGTRSRLTSNYAEVQAGLAAEHGAANTYLISRRFLNWATPERLSGEFPSARPASGPATVPLSAEAHRQIQLEYEDVAAWFRLKGISDLGPDSSAILAELIRTGVYPRLGLAVKTTQVEYYRELETSGRTDVHAGYLERLGPKARSSDRPGRASIEKRPALAIIWTGPSGDQPKLATAIEGSFRQTAPAIKDLPKLLPPQTDPWIRRLVGETAQHGLLEIDSLAGPRRAARAAIGLRKEDLSAGAGSKGLIIDLRLSDLAEIVSGFLTQLALGNRKSCNLEVLELDQSTGRLEAEFTLRHQYVWPTLREAQLQLRAKLGAGGTDVEDLADLLPDTAFDGARKRYHQMDLHSHEASAKAYEAEQRARDAATRVATKVEELAALASELARAQSDLQTAAGRESLARQDAQAACSQMLALDAQVRIARNRANGLEPRSTAKPLLYGGRDTNKRW
jgi:hypothetical protein